MGLSTGRAPEIAQTAVYWDRLTAAVPDPANALGHPWISANLATAPAGATLYHTLWNIDYSGACSSHLQRSLDTR